MKRLNHDGVARHVPDARAVWKILTADVQLAPLMPHLAESGYKVAVRVGGIDEASVFERERPAPCFVAKLSHLGDIWDQNDVIFDAPAGQRDKRLANAAAGKTGVLGCCRTKERQEEQRSQRRDCGKRRFPHASFLIVCTLVKNVFPGYLPGLKEAG